MAKILLIDDEVELLEMMREALTNASHDVTAISNGSAVLNGTTGVDFDLVITDIIMPEAEGIEILNFVLNHNPRAKIIAISGGGCMGAPYLLQLAGRLGALVTLPKPFPLGTLVSTAEQMLASDRSAVEGTNDADAPRT